MHTSKYAALSAPNRQQRSTSSTQPGDFSDSGINPRGSPSQNPRASPLSFHSPQSNGFSGQNARGSIQASPRRPQFGNNYVPPGMRTSHVPSAMDHTTGDAPGPFILGSRIVPGMQPAFNTAAPGVSVFGGSLHENKPIPKTSFIKRATVKIVSKASDVKPIAAEDEQNFMNDKLKATQTKENKTNSADQAKAVDQKQADLVERHRTQLKASEGKEKVGDASTAAKAASATTPTANLTIKMGDHSDDDNADLLATFAKLSGVASVKKSGLHKPSITPAASSFSVRPSGNLEVQLALTSQPSTRKTVEPEVLTKPDGILLSLDQDGAQQWVLKAADYLESLPEFKGRSLTADEIKHAVSNIRALIDGKQRSEFDTEEVRDLYSGAVASYLNSLARNPGDPVTKSLICNMFRKNCGDYLDLCTRLVGFGVMSSKFTDIDGLSTAIKAAKLAHSQNRTPSTVEFVSTPLVRDDIILNADTETPATPPKPLPDTQPIHAVETTPKVATPVRSVPAEKPATLVKTKLKGAVAATKLAAHTGATSKTLQPAFAPANMDSWPSQMRRDKPAQRRRLFLKGFPSDWTLAKVQAHIWGGCIERIEIDAPKGSAWVKFMTSDGYDQYFAATANGIDVAGGKGVLFVSPDDGPNSTNDLLANLTEAGATRCIRATDAEKGYSMTTLVRLARGKDRKVDKIKSGTEKGRYYVEFRFSSIYEALVFRKELLDDEDWEPATIAYAADPCALHDGIHLDD